MTVPQVALPHTGASRLVRSLLPGRASDMPTTPTMNVGTANRKVTARYRRMVRCSRTRARAARSSMLSTWTMENVNPRADIESRMSRRVNAGGLGMYVIVEVGVSSERGVKVRA